MPNKKPGTPRPPPNPLDEFERATSHHPDRKRVLFEGDSWLAYPRGNLVSAINSAFETVWLDLSANGDELVSIVSGPQRRRLRETLKRFDFDVIVISGGGNDIVGVDLFPLLRDFKASYSPADCIDDAALNRRLQMLGLSFQEIVTLRDYYDPAAVIVVHTYDYAIPNGKGFKFVIEDFAGPWLKPSMDERGIQPDLDFRSEIVRILIDRYANTVMSIATTIPNFKVVDSRGTLRTVAEWDNELHPKRDGFVKIVTERWVPVLKPILGA